MDVRCDNCGTEYELDAGMLRPGGVTVQCTSCGHRFAIGGRAATAVGLGSSSNALPPAGARTSTGDDLSPGDGAPREPLPVSPSGPRVGGKERNWLIRLPTGEIETCHELATLQQWIISGKVTPQSGISRTGQTWKRLGDIAELASFFEIAEEAHRAADEAAQAARRAAELRAKSEVMKTLQGVPVVSVSPGRSAPVTMEPVSDAGSSPVARPRAPGSEPGSGAVRAPGSEPGIGASSEPGSGAIRAPSHAEPVLRRSDTAGAGASGAWRGAVRSASGADGDGPQGPTGGQLRRRTAQDTSFGGKIRPIQDGFGRPSEPIPGLDEDEDLPAETGGGAGRWIVLCSLVLMAGAAFVVYWFVFRERGFAFLDEPAAVVEDAGVDAVPEPPDAASPDAAYAELLAVAGERLAGDTRAGLEAILAELDQAAAGDEAEASLGLLVARARVQTALAQHLFDASAAQGGAEDTRGLRRQAEQRVLAALALAQKALKRDRENPGAQVVMADILRLQKKPAAQVDRYLDQALAQDANDREARLVQALARAAAGKADEARAALAALAAAPGDVRPQYRLARLDFEAGRHDDAKQHAGAVVAEQPGHEGALALIERIHQAMAVDTSDPMPPEEAEPEPTAPQTGEPRRPARGRGDSASEAPAGSSYDALLAQADRRREAGKCNEAVDLYERALDINPIGVDALTGMGYCHVERREFASAHGKFRAALGVSSRNPEAIWGMAEAYTRQGLAEKAIEWYQRYLDEHPNGNRASTARRQIEQLRGSAAPPAEDSE